VIEIPSGDPNYLLKWCREQAAELRAQADEDPDYALEGEALLEDAADYEMVADAIEIPLRALDRAVKICKALSGVPEVYEAEKILGDAADEMRREREGDKD